MVAVLFTTSPVLGGSLLWVMLAVLAMGIGSLVGWRKPIPAPVKRIVVAALIAVALCPRRLTRRGAPDAKAANRGGWNGSLSASQRTEDKP